MTPPRRDELQPTLPKLVFVHVELEYTEKDIALFTLKKPTLPFSRCEFAAPRYDSSKLEDLLEPWRTTFIEKDVFAHRHLDGLVFTPRSVRIRFAWDAERRRRLILRDIGGLLDRTFDIRTRPLPRSTTKISCAEKEPYSTTGADPSVFGVYAPVVRAMRARNFGEVDRIMSFPVSRPAAA